MSEWESAMRVFRPVALDRGATWVRQVLGKAAVTELRDMPAAALLAAATEGDGNSPK